MDFLTWLSLASDAVWLAIAGGCFILVAGFAMFMEWRRNRSRPLDQLERVGWVPWMIVFLGCFFIGMGLLVVSLPVLLGE
jgi:uncharacterized membrane protein YfcA